MKPDNRIREDETVNSPASEPSGTRSESPGQSGSGDPIASRPGEVHVRLREMSQLFDSLDPSPFFEQDLDRNAEEYIIDSVKEFHSAADWELVIHLDQAPGPPEERSSVETAIGIHFARRSRLLKRDLRRLMRRGVISLGIGLAFLTASFIIAELLGRVIGDSHYRTLLREGFLIFGWVAVWKPLEIFLYDWWPILGQRRMHDRLSRIKVRIICSGSGPRRPTRELRGSGPEAPPKNERQNLT